MVSTRCGTCLSIVGVCILSALLILQFFVAIPFVDEEGSAFTSVMTLEPFWKVRIMRIIGAIVGIILLTGCFFAAIAFCVAIATTSQVPQLHSRQSAERRLECRLYSQLPMIPADKKLQQTKDYHQQRNHLYLLHNQNFQQQDQRIHRKQSIHQQQQTLKPAVARIMRRLYDDKTATAVVYHSQPRPSGLQAANEGDVVCQNIWHPIRNPINTL